MAHALSQCHNKSTICQNQKQVVPEHNTSMSEQNPSAMQNAQHIFWPNTISNIQLHLRTNSKTITQEVKLEVDGTMCLSRSKVALRWTPDGHRRRGRPMETWGRTVEKQMQEQGWTQRFSQSIAVETMAIFCCYGLQQNLRQENKVRLRLIGFK